MVWQRQAINMICRPGVVLVGITWYNLHVENPAISWDISSSTIRFPILKSFYHNFRKNTKDIRHHGSIIGFLHIGI
jgi:hypothetical protein